MIVWSFSCAEIRDCYKPKRGNTNFNYFGVANEHDLFWIGLIHPSRVLWELANLLRNLYNSLEFAIKEQISDNLWVLFVCFSLLLLLCLISFYNLKEVSRGIMGHGYIFK